MFHGISAALSRLVRRIADRQSLPFEYAAWHGWETRRIRRGTYQFRDPRFGQLAAARAVQAPSGRTWAQAAMAAHIRTLGSAVVPAPGKTLSAGTSSDGCHECGSATICEGCREVEEITEGGAAVRRSQQAWWF